MAKKELPEDIFKNTTTSYKYFWFIAILQLLKEESNSIIGFDKIVSRMVADAWPLIIKERLYLGVYDGLSGTVWYYKGILYEVPNTSYEIYKYLEDRLYEKNINKPLRKFYKEVPFRFLSPWITKEQGGGACFDLEKAFSDDYMYGISNNQVVINPSWVRPLLFNYKEYVEYTLENLAAFIETRSKKTNVYRIIEPYFLPKQDNDIDTVMDDESKNDQHSKERSCTESEAAATISDYDKKEMETSDVIVIDGKIVSIKDGTLLDELSVRYGNGGALKAIAFLSDKLRNVSGITMSMKDWGDLVTRTMGSFSGIKEPIMKTIFDDKNGEEQEIKNKVPNTLRALSEVNNEISVLSKYNVPIPEELHLEEKELLLIEKEIIERVKFNVIPVLKELGDDKKVLISIVSDQINVSIETA